MDSTIKVEDSIRLKGLAIIMMVSMHLMKTKWMNNPMMLIDFRIGEEYLAHIISESLHASTAIFAFLTGYAWGGCHYSRPCKKIISIYLSFWLVTVMVNLPVKILDSLLMCETLDWLTLSELVKTGLAISSNISRFCWYISFYAFAVITFPFLSKLLSKVKTNIYVKMVLVIVVFFLLRFCVRKMYSWNLLGEDILSLIQHYNTTMPRVLVGALICQGGVYDLWNVRLKKVALPLSVLIMIAITTGKTFLVFGLGIESEFDVIWIIFEMYALVNIVKALSKITYVDCILLALGRYSLYIWLMHAVLLNDIIQNITYAARIPIIIITVALLINLIVATFIQRLDYCIKKKLRI